MPVNNSTYSRLAIAVIFLFLTLIVNSQDIAGVTDIETLKLIAEVPEDMSRETGAMIILKDYQMTVNEKGQKKLVVRVLGKVYDKTAMIDYSQIPLRFNSFYEDASLNYARVIHSDGTFREVPRDAVQIKTTPDYEGLQYNDSRYLSFALSGMEPGAVFDYKVTFSDKRQVIEGEWFNNHWFGGMLQNLSPPFLPRIDPVLRSIFTLTVPAGTKFNYFLYSGKVEPIKRSIGNQDEYKWVLERLETIKIEDAMPPLSKHYPVLILSSIDNWDKIDRWAAGKILSHVETTGEVSSKAKAVTIGKNTADEKIQAIKNFIQTNIQYVYSDLDRGGYEPHSANETLKSRYGDCKDQSVLLISMLKAVGIEAFPALINPRPYDELIDIPVPLFSHLIALVPANNRKIWLDMTSSSTPYPDLNFSNQDRNAFVVNGNGGRFEKTPSATENENITNFELNTNCSDNAAVVNMTLEAKGAPSDMLKQVLKELDKNSLKEAVNSLAKMNNNKAETDSLSISDLHNPDSNFRLYLKYHIDSIWIRGQSGISFGSHAFVPLSIVTNLSANSLPDNRYNDIIVPYLYTVKGKENYSIPVKDFLHIEFPGNDSLKSEFFDFDHNFNSSQGKLEVEWTIRFKENIIEKTKYKGYKDAVDEMTKMLSWKIDYVDPHQYISSVSRSETSANMLSYSNQIIKNDPDNLLALLLKGMAYTKNSQYELATSLYQDIIKRWPENKYAYVYISYPLLKRNNSNEAIDYLNKAMSIDPDFGFAYLTRGNIFESQGSLERALADYNSALKTDPDDIFSLKSKMQLLGRMGRELESFACLEEMLRIDSTNTVLCTTLAQYYMSKNLYKKAISMFQKAVQIDQNIPENWGSLGWAYYLDNNDAKSIEASKRALEIKQSTYFARYNLGLAYLRSGNISEARKIYAGMKAIRSEVPQSDIKGAISDLNDLRSKGIRVAETKAVLKEFF